MRRGLALLLGFVVLLTIPTGAASPPSPDTGGELRDDLDGILEDPRLEGATAGVVVRDPRSDRVLYARNPRTRMTPASNAKLFTSVAALETLGEDFRFDTEVLATGERRGAELRGELYLRGTGDPTMLAADYRELAAEVAASGIEVVRGRVLADDSWFTGPGLANGWMAVDEPYHYAAPVSALTVAPTEDYDAGSVLVRVRPGDPGTPVRVSTRPSTGAVTVVNRARTSSAGSPETLSVRREHGSDRVLVSGELPADSGRKRFFSSVPDPTRYALDVFRRALAEHGVSFEGVGTARTPERARVLAEHRSMPLGELLTPFLKLSNNGHAETLVKTMGRRVLGEGSWTAGMQVLRNELDALGVDPGSYRLVDGSGLSTLDAVSPRQLSLLLDAARAEPWFDTWYAALPVAGAPERLVGGTLRGRMGGTAAEGEVVAKTGSMTGVTALSGYVRTRSDRPLVFSVVFNDFLGAAPRDVQDALAVRLAEHGGDASPGTGDPRSREHDPPRISAGRDGSGVDARRSALECSWTKSCRTDNDG
ncbi:D-alanyl-D-alanine carboxypeptidase/D-alanyl-D-alanine endopeptidase [Actinopolyspora saharensis]|uniref:D-alanyl-D-alanine carboxypeptidase / D-alanyl-D-alanine-endopeptidase (Penicillin-binding protein 4) n=1 Tax=Actinopolyspora saharensis TaxID=995062 RepID=A0A1H1AMA9_9ACTN|nr:D-alanyl-D-alanine carboxypeptidase/D-alanyl-D-alanine-endopeptidase [Actinopolyspora saharensis]SDQ40787.1 D-alanyl-D-alanine carboxypeptidase / D-alanyl-D-alanine-endopeptidase (penicillin-binding protein 4) [Actinopolyspora saharensis]